MPFSPKRVPFFYGWVILFVGVFGTVMSIPGQTMGVSVFTDSLIRVLSISREQLSLAYLIGTLGSAVILTPAGKTLDRYGTRAVGSVIILVFGFVLVGMSIVDKISFRLAQYVAFEQKIISFIVITIGFFLLRFLGQGMLTLSSRTMVMKWFNTQRGFANAIMGIFVSFLFSFAPRIFDYLIQKGNWASAWRNIGIFILLFGVIIYWVLSRDNPTLCNMQADSPRSLLKKKRPVFEPLERDFTFKEATKTFPFWIFGLTLCMHSLFVTAFTFHISSIFEKVEMSRLQAISIFLPASIISVGINFFVSFLSDYIKLKYVFILHNAGLVFAMISVIFLAPGLHYIVLFVAYGIISGVFNVSISVVWPRYYGLTHLGQISGAIMAFTVIGSAFGPYLFSIVEKYTGSYNFASLICLCIVVVLFVCSLKAEKPKLT